MTELTPQMIGISYVFSWEVILIQQHLNQILILPIKFLNNRLGQ